MPDRSKNENNSAKLWNDLWSDPSYRPNELYGLRKEACGVRWRRICQQVRARWTSFEGLDMVELGAGAGKTAALCAQRGANVTLVDYSGEALGRASELFDHLDLEASLLQQDVLELPADLHGSFDLSMSFGLAEHFRSEDRTQIIKSHFASLRPGGLAFIAVPNRYNLPYRAYKAITEQLGTWKYGEEYPYSRREFKKLCDQLGIDQYRFIGDSFWSSFRFFNLIGDIRKAMGIAPRRRWGTPWDEYISYSLVLCAKRPERRPISP